MWKEVLGKIKTRNAIYSNSERPKKPTVGPSAAEHIDGERFFVPQGDNCSMSYERVWVVPFDTLEDIDIYLGEMEQRANDLGLKITERELRRYGWGNHHWGLLPPTAHKFSGTVRFTKDESSIIEHQNDDGENVSREVHDDLYVIVGNTGEVAGHYARWGNPPSSIEEKRKFLDNISLTKIS